jgi:lipoprotein-anchoring transpeptidase ErfK/SrfK
LRIFAQDFHHDFAKCGVANREISMHRIALFALFVLLAGAAPAAASTVRVTIDLSDQQMRVDAGFLRSFTWDVSTARRGYRTPTGTYRPIRTHEMWYSRKYNMSPMPHSIFFYGGYAIHGTTEVSRLGTPASHGCVRLDPENAAILFDLVIDAGWDNTTITIVQ